MEGKLPGGRPRTKPQLMDEIPEEEKSGINQSYKVNIRLTEKK